jgi:hypothetical protein
MGIAMHVVVTGAEVLLCVEVNAEVLLADGMTVKRCDSQK